MTKICLDAGHGGKDSGAYNSNLKLRESDINLRVVLKLADLLKKNGYEVILTRDRDIDVTLGMRCSIANQKKADLFISIHCNSATNKAARGTETYYYATSKNGNALARLVQQELIEATKFQNRGIKTAGYYVLKYTKMPAILIELGFISNDEEAKILASPQYQDKAIQAIFEAIQKYVKGVRI